MLATACDPPAAPPAPFRLVEQQAGSPIPTRKLDGTVLRVLDPGEPVQELALPSPPVASTLQVQMGVDPAAGDTRVLFEATLHAPGSPDTPLLRREITPGGWNAQRVPVPVAAAGASLRFRRTVLSGDPRALSLSAWGNPVLATAGAERPRDVPDIILISFDTLRADRLGCYGSTAGATPAFDAFAAEGVVYERAYSPSTWTLPSHRSMLSGRFPLAPEEPGEAPLPELLRRHGYRTAGFSGGGFMSEVFGFDAGFDSYYSYPGGTGGAKCPDDRFDGREVFDRARAWLEDHREEPAFLFLHTYDVHDTCPFQADPAAPSMHRKDPGPEARARELAYYNGLVVRLDGLFARFLEDLRQLGKAENTLVVVTADHGEAFWEHGFDGHGKGRKPYDELARVPLVLRWPSRLPAAVRVPQPVSNTAITATILGLVGAGVPDDLDARELPGVGLQEPGVDLLAAKVFEATQAGMLPDTGPPATWFLDPVYVHENNLLGVRTARHKLVTSRIDPNQTRVYDLATDPRETRNLAGRDPDLDAKLDALAARYWEKLAAAPSGSTKPVDDATRERLKALGYAE